MKLVRAVLASLCALAAAGPARAETWSKQLTPGKTADDLYSFTIKAERQKDNQAGEYLAFRVAVKPKAGTGKGHRSGTLEVYAGKEFVSSCEVRPAEKGGELSYSFRIAAKYAGKSRFIFAELLGEFDAAYYWFHPADFIDPAPPAPKPAAPLRIEGHSFLALKKEGKDFWAALAATPADRKLTGKLADHLGWDRIASVVEIRQADVAVAGFFDPDGGSHTSLDNKFREFLSGGGRFHTGRLPDWTKKYLGIKDSLMVLLVRTKTGEYGLITLFSGSFAVVELNGRVGVVLDEPEGKGKKEKGREPPAPPSKPQPAAGEKGGPGKCPEPAAAMPLIEILGFGSMTEAKYFREYWGSLPDDAKLTGKLSDHLTPDRIASVVALEVNGNVAGFSDPPRTSLDDDLKLFLTSGGLPAPHRFHTGRLPAGFEKDRPPKVYVLLFRTKKGEYGLITFYQRFVVVETNKQIGVVLLNDEGKAGDKNDKKEKGKEPGDQPAPSATPKPAEKPGVAADAGRPENAAVRAKWAAIPVPAKTPFDGDAKKRADYLRSYRDGYFWAQGNHFWGPTNPNKDNLHAIRGWVEGWKAGVKAGGTSGLPAKYAPYIEWRSAGDRGATPAAAPKPEPPVDLSRFPTLRGTVKTVLGHLNTYIPPKEGEPFKLSLKDLPKLTSLEFDPAKKSYTVLYGPAAVESVRYYTNGAFASTRLASKRDPKLGPGAVTIDIIAGGGKAQVWVLMQSDVTKGVVLIEGEYDGTFPDRPK